MFEVLGMVLCFIGVIGIALSKSLQSPPNVISTTSDKPSELLGIFICFFMSWLYAGCNVINRKLKDVHFAIVGFYHPLSGLIMFGVYYLVMLIWYGKVFEVHDWSVYGGLIIMCVLDFVSLNSQNIAFQSDSSGFVAVIGYLIIFYGFLADQFIFSSPITGFDLAGAALILVVTVSVTLYKLKQKFDN